MQEKVWGRKEIRAGNKSNGLIKKKKSWDRRKQYELERNVIG